MKHDFRTNTVRNTQFTKPYMYNGIFQTLEQVIDFYNAGGGKGKGLQIENQTLSSDSLKLTVKEKKSLLHFIQSLNENIPPTVPPKNLPLSSVAAYNSRKVGGEY
jgi:cytochrome c peroxidase